MAIRLVRENFIGIPFKLATSIEQAKILLVLSIIFIVFVQLNSNYQISCHTNNKDKSVFTHLNTKPIINKNIESFTFDDLKGSIRHSKRETFDELLSHDNKTAKFYQQTNVLDQCCACDEAKYELVFEGLWSRYTHPDDFPDEPMMAHFSDIIGASHSNDFRMWAQDSYASNGVKELAETGSTKKLEAELKQVSSKTRTIIKARELLYPTLNSKTSAVFRTDRQHHLVSILSKLGPSPDWMVGVSGLELCQADCSWVNQRIVNLYLWDAGTDSGANFNSEDSPSRPQEKIHPFKKVQAQQHIPTTQRPSLLFNVDTGNYMQPPTVTNYRKKRLPNQREYFSQDNSFSSQMNSNQNNDQQKPYARLTIIRQRIYEKSCNLDSTVSASPSQNFNSNKEPQKNSYNNKNPNIRFDSWTMEPTRTPPSYPDCKFTEWSDWSACSSTCGRGIRTRTRSFLDEQAHLAGCSQVDLIEKEICLSECVGNTTCITRDWSEWSKCSVDCGQGFKKRTRSLIGPSKRACQSIDLAEMEACTGNQTIARDDCLSEKSPCELTDWSQWSDCSVACGKGVRLRTRQYVRKDNIENCSAKLIQKQSCLGRQEFCKDSTSSNGQQLRNNSLVIDCKLSAWTPWSACSAPCGNGRKTRSRHIIQMPQNGGKPCDEKLTKTQRCRNLPPCPSNQQLFNR